MFPYPHHNKKRIKLGKKNSYIYGLVFSGQLIVVINVGHKMTPIYLGYM